MTTIPCRDIITNVPTKHSLISICRVYDFGDLLTVVYAQWMAVCFVFFHPNSTLFHPPLVDMLEPFAKHPGWNWTYRNISEIDIKNITVTPMVAGSKYSQNTVLENFGAMSFDPQTGRYLTSYHSTCQCSLCSALKNCLHDMVNCLY